MNKEKNTLAVKDLTVKVGNKIILNKINLVIYSNELHVILGPNGNGKSTLLQTIMGNPKYEIVSGSIMWNNVEINSLSPEERSKLGLFLGWQNPVEIPGLSNIDYLKLLLSIHSNKKISTLEFYNILNEKLARLNLPKDFLERYFNVNFSGGEKKKNEILQLLLIEPNFIMLDEIDSGLDVDSIKIIKSILKEEFSNKNKSGLIITHYMNFLKLLPIDKVHVILNGQIVETGKDKLISDINKFGFSHFYKKYNLNPNQKDIILEHCAVGEKFVAK